MKINKAVILAGGKGTRLAEQTKYMPKPLVRVQGKPIVERIMEHLASEGVTEFYLLGGYMIEELYKYFLSNMADGSTAMIINGYISITSNNEALKDCKINIIDTGLESGTAERIKKVQSLINDNFILTYGDTYSDVNMSKVEEQLTEDRVLALCAIPYKERFGLVKIKNDNEVEEFKEKSESKIYFVNGGFMCVKPDIFNYIKETDFDFSKDTLESEDLKGKIGAYIHRGYWRAVDTQRDLDEINREIKEIVDEI